MNRRRGTLTMFVWPPSLQVIGLFLSACAFICYNRTETAENQEYAKQAVSHTGSKRTCKAAVFLVEQKRGIDGFDE